jgi:hypothetical protein
MAQAVAGPVTPRWPAQKGMAREHDARWRRELLSLFARDYPRSLCNRGGRPGRGRGCVRLALSGRSAASDAAVVQARACLESSGPEELESTRAKSPQGSASLLFTPGFNRGPHTESRQGCARSFRRTRPIHGPSLETRGVARVRFNLRPTAASEAGCRKNDLPRALRRAATPFHRSKTGCCGTTRWFGSCRF